MLGAVLAALLAGCSDRPFNDPYPGDHSGKSILYDSFAERPKHLDPVSSYSENEAKFLGQIYEPIVQYHFLKRPYELTPLTATAVPQPEYIDSEGNPLPADAPGEAIAEVRYRISIQPGIRFQPHPAFARDESGAYRYHGLDEDALERVQRLDDFAETGTRELTAEDYVYQVKRLVHPHLHSPIAGFMAKYIVGLEELAAELRAGGSSPGDYLDLRAVEIAGVKALDRYTYEIRLKEKYPQFVYWLAMSFFAPVPWEADAFYFQPGMKERNLTMDWYPIGTGPYMLTDNNPNRRMVLERNPNFRGEPYPDSGEPGDRAAGMLDDAGKQMPFIDVAYYSLEKEAIPEWNKFLQGYFDTAGILSDSFDQAIQFNAAGEAGLTPVMRERDIGLLTAITASVSYIGFNMTDDVVGGYDDAAVKLRRALSIAMDYEELISIFANGRGVAAQGPIPPGIFGNREGAQGINPYVYEWRDGRPRRRSIEEARQLLAEAGYPGGRSAATGEPLVLYFEAIASGPGSKPILNWYRKQLDKLNIQLIVRTTDYNRFQEKVRTGKAQMFGWGWNADYPDPENFLFLLYGPNSKVISQGENASNYQNEEFDQLFVKMRSLPNGSERQQAIDRMLELVRRDAPWIWGFHPKAYSLYHSWYGNAKPNLMARNALKYKTIDPQARLEARKRWNRPVWWPVAALALLLAVSIIPAVVTYRRHQQASAL